MINVNIIFLPGKKKKRQLSRKNNERDEEGLSESV